MDKCLQIGEFVFDYGRESLSLNGDESRLEPLTLEFLRFLILHRGEVVNREQLLAAVWKNRQVTDDSIRRVVKKLRQAFADDARSPRYIKTVSMQGYSLIAPVSAVPTPVTIDVTTTESGSTGDPANSSSSPLSRGVVYGLIAGVVTGALMSIAVMSWLADDAALMPHGAWNVSGDAQTLTREPRIEALTSLSGSEMNGQYSAANDTLLFLYRHSDGDGLGIYTKHMPSGVIKRISNDEASYHMAKFSPSGEKLVYLRQDGEGFHSWQAEYDSNRGIINAEELAGKTEHPDQKPISWSSDGESVYFAGREPGGKQESIHRLKLGNGEWGRLTFPNTAGRGDYFAKESPDGESLAILRNVADRRFTLIVMNLADKTVLVETTLNFYATSVVWDENSRSMVLSSFKGDFYHYSIDEGQLREQAGSRPGLNDVFYRCGDNCFYMRRHHMNYSDVREISNPFLDGKAAPTLYIESANADFNPIYNRRGDTLYYTSKNEKQARLIRHRIGDEPEILRSYNPRYIINNLHVNSAETHLLGKVENRIFLLNLASMEFKYITSALEEVNFPAWKDNDTILFMRQEYNRKVILRYEVERDKLEQFDKDVLMYRYLDDGRVFRVDQDSKLYQISDGGDSRYITQLPFHYNAQWQIHGPFLYFTHYLGESTALSRQLLGGGEVQSRVLARHGGFRNFSIHPDGKKILINQSNMADSDLVKVEW